MNYSCRSRNTVGETIETIAAMREQEVTGYVTCDWLNLQHNDIMSFTLGNDPLCHDFVEVDCRDKMVLWCIQVVDFCKFRRETVEITMSYLDRFMATTQGEAARNDRNIYQLASMAALYTAVKIHEPEAMDPKLVSSLSRGAYLPEDIEAMEAKMLQALKWRVNPPTSLAFVRQLLDLIPEDTLDQRTRKAAYELTQFQTELSVCNYQLIAVPASSVGYAAFINALESLNIDEKVLRFVNTIVLRALQLDDSSRILMKVQGVLYNAVIEQPMDGPLARVPRTTTSTGKQPSRGVSGTTSPRSISAKQL